MDKLEEWEKKRLKQSLYFLLTFIVVGMSILTWKSIITSDVYTFFIGLIIGATLYKLNNI